MVNQDISKSDVTLDERAKLERDGKNLKFELLRNAFYHSDELWFFTTLERSAKFISAMAGTGVVGTVIANHHNWAVALGFMVAIFQIGGLVFGWSSRALLHESKRQRYFTLLADLESQSLTRDNISRIESQMTRTYGEEPPTMWGVEVVAYNTAVATTRTDIRPGDLIPITGWEKLTRFIRPFDSEYFRNREHRQTV